MIRCVEIMDVSPRFVADRAGRGARFKKNNHVGLRWTLRQTCCQEIRIHFPIDPYVLRSTTLGLQSHVYFNYVLHCRCVGYWLPSRVSFFCLTCFVKGCLHG